MPLRTMLACLGILLFFLLRVPSVWSLTLSGGPAGGVPTVDCPDQDGKHLNFTNGLWSCGSTISTAGLTPGETHGFSQTTLTSVAGSPTLTATGRIPAGVKVKAVQYTVVTAFSQEQGLESVDLGGMGVSSGWGDTLGITAGVHRSEARGFGCLQSRLEGHNA